MGGLVQYWTPPRMWAGTTVYIVGGGPSLPVDVVKTRLPDWPVIAVNDAYALSDQFAVCFFNDAEWWNRHKDALLRWPGMKVTSNGVCRPFKDVQVMMRDTRNAWTRQPDAVGWGHNSGIGALNLAIKFGAARVVLLGFDMHKDKWERDNWHVSTNPTRVFVKPERYTEFLGAFAQFKSELDDDVRCGLQEPVTIVNATPGSAMTTFPIVDWRTELPPSLIDPLSAEACAVLNKQDALCRG